MNEFRTDRFFFPHLRILDLTNNNLREEGIMYLSILIHSNNCPNLEELSLISIIMIYKIFLKLSFRYPLNPFPGYQCIGNRMKDEGLLKLVQEMRFGFLSHLKLLYLSDNQLTDRSVSELTKTIANHRIAPSAELHIGCKNG